MLLPPLPVPFPAWLEGVLQDGMQRAYLPKPIGCIGGEGECDLRPHLWDRTTEREGRATSTLSLWPRGSGGGHRVEITEPRRRLAAKRPCDSPRAPAPSRTNFPPRILLQR